MYEHLDTVKELCGVIAMTMAMTRQPVAWAWVGTPGSLGTELRRQGELLNLATLSNEDGIRR